MNMPEWEIAGKMLVALRYGTLEDCRQLLVGGADTDQIFKINSISKPALHIAVERCSIDIVELLLSSGGAVDRRDSLGRTALHLSIEMGYEDTAQLLLFHRADVNLPDDLGHSPLHYAVKRGSINLAKVLLERGADVSRRDSNGHAPLTYMTSNSNATFELISLLLEYGARADETDNSGLCTLGHILQSRNYTFKMVEILLQNGASLTLRTNSGKALIHLAILSSSNQKWESLALMLKYKCDVNLKTRENQTLLHLAVQMRDLCSIGILLRAGADLNTVDCLGFSPLSYALIHVRWKPLVFLLAIAGARIPGEEFRKLSLDYLSQRQRSFLLNRFSNAMTLKDQSRISVWKCLGADTMDWLHSHSDELPATLCQFLQFDVQF